MRPPAFLIAHPFAFVPLLFAAVVVGIVFQHVSLHVYFTTQHRRLREENAGRAILSAYGVRAYVKTGRREHVRVCDVLLTPERLVLLPTQRVLGFRTPMPAVVDDAVPELDAKGHLVFSAPHGAETAEWRLALPDAKRWAGARRSA